MKQKIKLNDEHFAIAKKFASDTAVHHRRNGRDFNTVLRNIISGKLGEIAAYQIDPDNYISPPDLEPSIDPDPGYDLIDVNGNKIDVKTVKKGTRTITFSKTLKADLYAIIEIDDDGYFSLIDTKTNEFMKKNMRQSKFNDTMYIFI